MWLNESDLLYNHSLQDALKVFALILARLTAIINLVPFLGSKNAPPQAKLGMALLFALIFWPMVATQTVGKVTDGLLIYLLFLLKEMLIGFAIGFVTAQIFYCVEMMGQIVDVVRATNQAQLLVPELQERSSAFGNFNYQLMLVIFLTLGLQVPFFNILGDSFIKLPILSFTPNEAYGFEVAEFFAVLLQSIFAIAVTLALPIGLVCLLSDIAFGLLNRVAPQINAYFLSMPAKAVGGMIIFLAAFSMIVEQFSIYGQRLLNSVSEAINLLN